MWVCSFSCWNIQILDFLSASLAFKHTILAHVVFELPLNNPLLMCIFLANQNKTCIFFFKGGEGGIEKYPFFFLADTNVHNIIRHSLPVAWFFQLAFITNKTSKGKKKFFGSDWFIVCILNKKITMMSSLFSDLNVKNTTEWPERYLLI